MLFRRSSSNDRQRLKSGKGHAVSAFMRMFITTSGLYSSPLNWYLLQIEWSRRQEYKEATSVQFEDSQISKTVVLFCPELMVQIVLEYADIGGVVSIWIEDV